MRPTWIEPNTPALVLAPMEGVTDAPMRAFLTERGAFTFCVSEFLRINQEVPPAWIYREHVPEFENGCRTPSGVPVQIQLLGGNEERLAESASLAVEIGATAIDLNFGCPAPTVNRHDGGASILRTPERVRKIVTAVRNAVPKEIPVSAKLRLGWDCMDDIFVNAEQAVLGGASWITIHARTKTQGYVPPAHWKYIGELKRRMPEVPIVANGEIWTIEDFRECRDVTGCSHFMIGRGALADPSLPLAIARELGIPSGDSAFSHTPQEWTPLLQRFSELTEEFIQRQERGRARNTQYTSRRIKQWMGFVGMRRPLPWIHPLKRTQNLDELFSLLRNQY